MIPYNLVDVSVDRGRSAGLSDSDADICDHAVGGYRDAVSHDSTIDLGVGGNYQLGDIGVVLDRSCGTVSEV